MKIKLELEPHMLGWTIGIVDNALILFVEGLGEVGGDIDKATRLVEAVELTKELQHILKRAAVNDE